jgi:hypothetical protein
MNIGIYTTCLHNKNKETQQFQMPSPSGEHPWAKKIGHLKIGTDVKTLYHPAKKCARRAHFFWKQTQQIWD